MLSCTSYHRQIHAWLCCALHLVQGVSEARQFLILRRCLTISHSNSFVAACLTACSWTIITCRGVLSRVFSEWWWIKQRCSNRRDTSSVRCSLRNLLLSSYRCRITLELRCLVQWLQLFWVTRGLWRLLTRQFQVWWRLDWLENISEEAITLVARVRKLISLVWPIALATRYRTQSHLLAAWVGLHCLSGSLKFRGKEVTCVLNLLLLLSYGWIL